MVCREQVTFSKIMMTDKHALLVFYSVSSLTQQSPGSAASLGHIIMIPSQPVFALTP